MLSDFKTVYNNNSNNLSKLIAIIINNKRNADDDEHTVIILQAHIASVSSATNINTVHPPLSELSLITPYTASNLSG
jgi:hypothetical protein